MFDIENTPPQLCQHYFQSSNLYWSFTTSKDAMPSIVVKDSFSHRWPSDDNPCSLRSENAPPLRYSGITGEKRARSARQTSRPSKLSKFKDYLGSKEAFIVKNMEASLTSSEAWSSPLQLDVLVRKKHSTLGDLDLTRTLSVRTSISKF